MRVLDHLNRSVPISPVAEATTRNQAAEADPRAAGLTADAVARIWASVEDLYRSGSYPAVALCLRRRGQLVIDGAIGHARGGKPATPATLFNLFSASKAITAMVLHLL